MRMHLLNDPKLTNAAAFLRRFENAEIVKYSPGKRSLFKVSIGSYQFFVKLFPKKFRRGRRGLKIHRAGIQLWRAAAARLVSFRVPVPVFWDDETRSLWQRTLEGEAAANLAGDATFASIGRAIAEIATLSIAAPRVFGREEQISDTREFGGFGSQKFPRIAQMIGEMTNRVAFAHRALPQGPLVPAHGDMHLDQWLCRDGSLGLLDFEDFSMAEAERDAAFFCVQLASEYGSAFDTDRAEQSVLTGLEAAGITPDMNRFAIYKSHKWLAKIAKACDETQARAILRRAENELEVIR